MLHSPTARFNASADLQCNVVQMCIATLVLQKDVYRQRLATLVLHCQDQAFIRLLI